MFYSRDWARCQTLVIVCDRNKVVGSIPHDLAPLKIEEEPTEIREPKDALCMSVRLSSSPRFVVSKATVNTARSRASTTRVYGSDVHCKRALNADTVVCR